MPIRLVTDSNCDLPADLVERHGIVVVPSVLVMEGKSYRDGVDISRAEFYGRLPGLKQAPTTAAPAAGDFEAAYRRCGQADIISIHVASRLSAILNSARLGAEASGKRVTLVDSGQLSMGLGWQVLAAAEAVATAKTLAEVLAAVDSVSRRIKVFALLDTVEYLRRSGRASALTASLGALLQIRPLVELAGGQVIAVAKLRARGKAIEKVIETVEALGPLERLAVLHTDCLQDARVLADHLAPRLVEGPAAGGARPPLIVEATPVIGTHVGPRALGIAAVRAA